MYAFKPGRYSSHGVILQWAGQGFGRRLLDVGSGPGALAFRLGRHEWKVTRIDKCGYGGSWEPEVLADLDRDRPEHLGMFDTIVCADILEHLAVPADVLRWLVDLLVIEGRLIVSVPNVAHWSVRLALLIGRWTTTERGILDRTHRHFYTRQAARGLLVSSGFRIVRESATPPPVALVLRGWPKWAEALHARLARAWPTLFGYQSIFLCEHERTR